MYNCGKCTNHETSPGGGYIFWGFRKLSIFLRYEDFVDIFGGSSQNWASFRVISMQFRVFFKVNVQYWDIFLGC